MKKKSKQLEVRKPSHEVRLASNVYFILILAFYSMIGIVSLGALILLCGIIAFKTHNMSLLTQIKTIAPTILVIMIIMFIILYPIKNTIEPETQFEKDAFLVALKRIGLKSTCEIERYEGVILRIKREGFHFSSSEIDRHRLYLKLENDQIVDYSISLDKDRKIIKTGQKIKLRNSNLKLPISGWCSDHLSISVIDETGKTFYKFESFEPFNNKIKLKGRKIIG